MEHHPRYSELQDEMRLHCGDASEYKFEGPNVPPLKLVIHDGVHLTEHMTISLVFWFPRIDPGGMLVVENIHLISKANNFQMLVVSQVMKDLYYCGGGKIYDEAYFLTSMHLLQSMHCEIHIYVFEQNV